MEALSSSITELNKRSVRANEGVKRYCPLRLLIPYPLNNCLTMPAQRYNDIEMMFNNIKDENGNY